MRCEREKLKIKKELDKNCEEVKDVESEAVVFCDLCRNEFNSSQFGVHDCMRRMMRCEFCNEDVHAFSFYEHQADCGNRTERCPRCNEYILRRAFYSHISSNNCAMQIGPMKSDEELRDEAMLYRKKIIK